MYLVTGGAGFIGSHLVKALNNKNDNGVIVVDDLSKGDKFYNLQNCRISDYYDKEELFEQLSSGQCDLKPKVIFHQGACTDTTENDGAYMMYNNFTFSKLLYHFALENQIPFIYASSGATYGNNRESEVIEENEKPLNVYGYSKLAFDQYVRAHPPGKNQTVIGLRYFNVYGPNETKKGKMASMVYQLYKQITETGIAKLFAGTDGYSDGEQRRDFVFVEDVIKVNLFCATLSDCFKIVNVGTGQSRSFNDVAKHLIKILGKGNIEYIPFDQSLSGKYQSFTEADIKTLREIGYNDEFLSLENGIEKTISSWQ